MLFSRIEVGEYARKVGKSERTLWRWIKEGCNLRDPKSLREWQVRNQIRETPIERARKRRRGGTLKPQQASSSQQSAANPPSEMANYPQLVRKAPRRLWKAWNCRKRKAIGGCRLLWRAVTR
jgi:hypothetical protein